MACTITAMLHYAGNPHNATEQHAQMQGAAIFRCPLIVALLFHALCGAQRSSASLPTDGAERALDFSRTMRYNSGTRTPRSRYHIIEKTGKMPTKYKGITPNTTFVKFHRTVALNGFESLFHLPTRKRRHSLLFLVGADDRTRTCTLARWNLNPMSLPIPPHPRIHLTIIFAR